jgi:uncharacterized membrane protein
VEVEIITHPTIIYWRAAFGLVMIAAIIYGLVTLGWGYIVRDLEHYGSQTYTYQHFAKNSTYIINYSKVPTSTNGG